MFNQETCALRMYLTIRQAAARQLRLANRHPRAQQLLRSQPLSTLAILEQRVGKLQPASLSSVTAAQKLGGPVTGFMAGSNIKAVAEEASKANGLDKIIAVENGAYDKVQFCGF